jgi:hypothetical protein
MAVKQHSCSEDLAHASFKVVRRFATQPFHVNPVSWPKPKRKHTHFASKGVGGWPALHRQAIELGARYMLREAYAPFGKCIAAVGASDLPCCPKQKLYDTTGFVP